MIKRLVSIIFVLNTAILYCQPEWELIPKIDRNAFTTLEGSIDNKYPVLMYLELTWNYCGPNNSSHWDPRIIKGWYEYKKIGKRIPLIGSLDGGDRAEYFLKLFVPDNILDTLDSGTCALNKFKEMFFIPVRNTSERYAIDTMQWSKYGQENFLSVYVKETHPSTWKTVSTLSFQVNGLNLVDINLTDLTKDEYIDKINVEAASQIDGNFYFIVRFGHLTSPGYFGSGQCGAGWEEWLAFIHINNSLEVEKFEYFQNASCSKLIDVEYSYNKDHPEYGIAAKNY